MKNPNAQIIFFIVHYSFTMAKFEEKEEERKKTQSWVKFSQIGFQMAATIGLGTWFGYWLDKKTNSHFYTVIFSLLAIGAALYNVIRQLPKE